jgi:hypothetical protein
MFFLSIQQIILFYQFNGLHIKTKAIAMGEKEHQED